MLLVRSRRATIFAALSAVVALNATSAQAGGGKTSPDVTRIGLEARARAADSLHRKEEAFVLHNRLQNGDFEVGDRLIAVYEGLGLQRTDTLVVQAGKVVRLGEPLGDLRLNGVLRFEVGDSVKARVDRYFRNEVVHVTPLIRLSISGAVRAPGFYYPRADMPLSELIMRTGGEDQAADLSNVVIKRGEEILWAKQDVAAALSDGLTLQRLDLESGDEIVVGARSSNRMLLAIQIIVPLLSAILVQSLLRRR